MKKGIIIAIAAIAVLGLGLFLFRQDAKNPKNNDPYAGKSSRDLALMCDAQEHVVLHIHPVLTINVNGQKQAIPANVGIEGLGTNPATHEQAATQATCLHFLHTHDATGTLHVESPIQMDYHLSDFFAVWGKQFNKTQILDSKVDDSHKISMTVNGKDSTAFENVVLKDQDQIVINYDKK